MRIFIPSSKTSLDFSGLEAIGKIHPLVHKTEKMDILNVSDLAKVYSKRLREVKYDPDKDVVAIVPPVINCAILFSVIMAEFESCQVAVFNVNLKCYNIKKLNIQSDWSVLQ